MSDATDGARDRHVDLEYYVMPKIKQMLKKQNYVNRLKGYRNQLKEFPMAKE